MPKLDIATLNIRNIADRWNERLPLLLADMGALQPDLLGLQECVFAVQQDRLIGAAGAAEYAVRRAAAARPEYGNSLLVRSPLRASEAERLDLGLGRSALRVRVEGAGEGERAGALTMVVTHLHHLPADEDARAAQTATLIEWLADTDGPLAVVGDFNAEPEEPTYQAMIGAGFRSAFAEANGAEPAVTWPSGIQAPGMDADGEPGCLDYIWLRGSLGARTARLVFDRPAVDDPTLYPSDHIGIVATVEIAG